MVTQMTRTTAIRRSPAKWLVLLIVVFAINVDCQCVQAKDSPRLLDLEIEVWSCPPVKIEKVLDEYGAEWARLTALWNLVEELRGEKQKPILPVRSSCRIDISKPMQVEFKEIFKNASASLVIDIKPAILFEGGVGLDYVMTRRDSKGEAKVSEQEQIEFGAMGACLIQPKSESETKSAESWLVVLIPRERLADGRDSVITLNSPCEENPLGLSFVPRPGSYEFHVPQGWTGRLMMSLTDLPFIQFRGSTNVGIYKDANAADGYFNLSQFRSERPVIEAVHTRNGIVDFVAVRPGIATLRTQLCLPGLGSQSTMCEMQIVVQADTAEFDRTIEDVLPDAKIKVTTIRDSVMLTGKVASKDDLDLLHMIAPKFFPNFIDRVKLDDQKSAEGQGLTAERLEETKSSRKRQRGNGLKELRALREDVRSLRDDVRRLSELLEKGQTSANPPARLPDASKNDAVNSRNKDKYNAANPLSPNRVLYFDAKWCGPCQQMTPIIRKLVREGCSIQTIDIDVETDLSKRFNIDSIPCFIRMENEIEVSRKVGIISEADLHTLASFGDKLRLQKALDKEISVNFQAKRLVEVANTIRQLIDANVVLDTRSLEEEGVDPNELVTIAVSNMSARSVLKLILEPNHLTFVIEDGVIKICSHQRALGDLNVRTYSVADLINPIEGAEKLLNVVTSTVTPDSWDVNGGPCSIRSHIHTLSLVIRQTRQGHDEIADLLQQLRKQRTIVPTRDETKQPIPANLDVPAPVKDTHLGETDADRKVMDALRKPVSLEFEGAPLWVVLGKIRELAGIKWTIDAKSLEEAELKPSTPVSIHVEGIQAISALKLILARWEMAPVIKDGVVIITSRQRAENVQLLDESSLFIQAYQVADLIVPIPDIAVSSVQPTNYTRYWLSLIDQIVSKVEPTKWQANGGPCSINSSEKDFVLIVQATNNMHATIKTLLGTMRREMDVQITMEIRFLPPVSEKMIAESGLNLDFDSRTKLVRLGHIQSKQLVKAIEGDRRGSLFAPKVTVFNDQFMSLGMTKQDSFPPFQLHARCHALDDKRHVRLNVAMNPDNIVDGLTNNSTVVPDGACLLIDITDDVSSSHQQRDTKEDLSSATNRTASIYAELASTGKRRFFLLLTPRIIIPNEHEEHE